MLLDFFYSSSTTKHFYAQLLFSFSSSTSSEENTYFFHIYINSKEKSPFNCIPCLFIPCCCWGFKSILACDFISDMVSSLECKINRLSEVHYWIKINCFFSGACRTFFFIILCVGIFPSSSSTYSFPHACSFS